MVSRPLHFIGKFYDLISNKYRVLPTRNQTPDIKDKLTKNIPFLAVHHLTENIQIHLNEQCYIFHELGPAAFQLYERKKRTNFNFGTVVKRTTKGILGQAGKKNKENR